jgi:hypothetical protein
MALRLARRSVTLVTNRGTIMVDDTRDGEERAIAAIANIEQLITFTQRAALRRPEGDHAAMIWQAQVCAYEAAIAAICSEFNLSNPCMKGTPCPS